MGNYCQERRACTLDATYGKSTLAPQSQLIHLLEEADKEQRPAILLAELTRIMEETLGTKGIAQDKGFFEMGMDSLMAVEAKTACNRF